MEKEKVENENNLEIISQLKQTLERQKISTTNLPESGTNTSSTSEFKRTDHAKGESKGSHLSLEFSKYSLERQEGEVSVSALRISNPMPESTLTQTF